MLREGHFYGVEKTGLQKCLGWRTAKRAGAKRAFGIRGSLTLARGSLLIQTAPALANSPVYARSYAGRLGLLDLRPPHVQVTAD